MGPIPAGSTLGAHLERCRPGNTDYASNIVLVFETELMGIKGVPKPESIVTKATASSDESATETATGAAEKIAKKVEEAAEVIGTLVADTDDTQEHNEL